MDKRYQVFVSSTYADLKDERQHVMQTLMEIDCIPAGMELFPAADEEQWQFIKKIIDDCDYYLLIVGGRYGSVTDEGISYTEKEFDYAIEKGLKVVALVHNEPESIPIGKSEKEPELREKLENFKRKVTTDRLVKFWKNSNELTGLVLSSMIKTIKTSPAIGWVRANKIANDDILMDINELRKENKKLLEINKSLLLIEENIIDNIVNIDSKFCIKCTYRIEVKGSRFLGSTEFKRKAIDIEITWKELFLLIAPYLTEYPIENLVRRKMSNYLTADLDVTGISIEEQSFQTIAIQFKAYDLITIKYKEMKNDNGGSLVWSLTDKGEKLMMENRVIKE